MKKIPIQDIRSIKEIIYKTSDTSDLLIARNEVISMVNKLPIRPSFYILALTTKGTVEMNVNGSSIKSTKNSLMIYTPFHTMDIMNLTPDYDCFVIGINNNYLETHQKLILQRLTFIKIGFDTLLKLNNKEVKLFIDYFKRITKLHNEKHIFHKEIITNLIYNLFYEIEYFYRSRKTSYDLLNLGQAEIITTKFLTLLQKNFIEQKNVLFYASKLNITSRHLGYTLQKTLGKSTKIIINEMILAEAKALLKEKNNNINDVTILLNFNTSSEFSHFFKKLTGESPSSYIKNS